MLDKNASGLPGLIRLAFEQGGVLSRKQVLAHGLSDCWLQHPVRARRWSRVHPGVYATFTGALAWEARCWAGLLRCGGDAALAGPSALHW
jgi:hypothetical protein